MTSIKVPLPTEIHHSFKELKKKTGKSMALLGREAFIDLIEKHKNDQNPKQEKLKLK